MVVSFVTHILPGIPGRLLEGDYALTTFHAIVGTVGMVLGCLWSCEATAGAQTVEVQELQAFHAYSLQPLYAGDTSWNHRLRRGLYLSDLIWLRSESPWFIPISGREC